MRSLVFIVAVFVGAITAAPALAKDICVQNAFAQLFKFDGIKLLKGKTTQLTGRFQAFGVNVPLDGALTLDSDGVTTRIGILTYPNPAGGSPTAVMWTMAGDKLFNATGSYDSGALGSIDGADTWTNVSCAGFPTAFPDRSPVDRAPGSIK